MVHEDKLGKQKGREGDPRRVINIMHLRIDNSEHCSYIE